MSTNEEISPKPVHHPASMEHKPVDAQTWHHVMHAHLKAVGIPVAYHGVHDHGKESPVHGGEDKPIHVHHFQFYKKSHGAKAKKSLIDAGLVHHKGSKVQDGHLVVHHADTLHHINADRAKKEAVEEPLDESVLDAVLAIVIKEHGVAMDDTITEALRVSKFARMARKPGTQIVNESLDEAYEDRTHVVKKNGKDLTAMSSEASAHAHAALLKIHQPTHEFTVHKLTHAVKRSDGVHMGAFSSEHEAVNHAKLSNEHAAKYKSKHTYRVQPHVPAVTPKEVKAQRAASKTQESMDESVHSDELATKAPAAGFEKSKPDHMYHIENPAKGKTVTVSAHAKGAKVVVHHARVGDISVPSVAHQHPSVDSALAHAKQLVEDMMSGDIDTGRTDDTHLVVAGSPGFATKSLRLKPNNPPGVTDLSSTKMEPYKAKKDLKLRKVGSGKLGGKDHHIFSGGAGSHLIFPSDVTKAMKEDVVIVDEGESWNPSAHYEPEHESNKDHPLHAIHHKLLSHLQSAGLHPDKHKLTGSEHQFSFASKSHARRATLVMHHSGLVHQGAYTHENKKDGHTVAFAKHNGFQHHLTPEGKKHYKESTNESFDATRRAAVDSQTMVMRMVDAERERQILVAKGAIPNEPRTAMHAIAEYFHGEGVYDGQACLDSWFSSHYPALYAVVSASPDGQDIESPAPSEPVHEAVTEVISAMGGPFEAVRIIDGKLSVKRNGVWEVTNLRRTIPELQNKHVEDPPGKLKSPGVLRTLAILAKMKGKAPKVEKPKP